MAYEQLKQDIAAYVKQNGEGSITGDGLQAILIEMVNSLGTGYKYIGVATPSTSAGTPSSNVFYLGGAGTYANFGTTFTVPNGSLAVIYYDTTWHNSIIRTDSDAFFNVNQYLGTPSTTYTKANARNAVPAALRSKGMIITYLTTNGWLIEQNLSTSGTWNADANWQTVGPVSVSQNIQTTLQEGTTEQVGDKTYNIGDFATQGRLNSDAANIITIEHNTIGTVDGLNVDEFSLRARTVNYISAPFEIYTNTGFALNAILRYSRDVNGQFTFVESIEPSESNHFVVGDNGYMYRITFKKTDDSEFTDSDLLNIVSSFKGTLATKMNNVQSKSTFFNVNSVLNAPTTYYTLANAINAIPNDDKRSLMTICYRTAENEYEFAQYLRSATADEYFHDASLWTILFRTNTLKLIEKGFGFTNVQIYNNTTTGYESIIAAATTIALADRKIGHILTFRDATTNTIWHTFQYKYSSISDTYWLNADSWIEINISSLSFSVLGGINKTTGKKQIGSNYYCTPYLKVAPGITIRGFEGTAIGMVTFFDMFFNYISALSLQAGEFHHVTLTAQDIPANAVYFRASGQLDTESGFVTGYGGSVIDDVAVWLWQSADLQDFTQYLTRGMMYGIGSISIGDTATMSENYATECAAIPCNQGDKFQISGSGGVGPRLWGWCDVDMKLISRADASVTESNLTLVAPTNAKYFIYNNIFADATAVLDKDNRIASNTDVAKSVWMALGDSITQGYYSDDIDPYYHLDPSKGWTNWVKRITGKTLINNAIGGTGFACKGPQGTSICGRELVDQLISQNAFDGVDLVTIAYGVNDWKYNYVLGDMTDTVDSSATKIIPSMRYVIERIIYANPNIKIIGIMPINCKVGGNYAGNWGIGYAFSNNGTLQQIYEAFKEVYDYYGIEYIDMLHSSIVNRNNIGQTLLDNVHPSVKAHEVMGRELAMKIKCY